MASGKKDEILVKWKFCKAKLHLNILHHDKKINFFTALCKTHKLIHANY